MATSSTCSNSDVFDTLSHAQSVVDPVKPQPRKSTGESPTATPQRSQPMDRPNAAASSPSSASKKVSPLIHSRHEWIQQEVEVRKRQSISEEEILRRKKEEKQHPLRGYLITTNHHPTTSDNNGSAESHTAATRMGDIVYDSCGTVRDLTPKFTGVFSSLSPRHSNKKAPTTSAVVEWETSMNDTGDNEQEEHRMIHYLPNQSMELSVDSLDAVDRQYWGHARRNSLQPNNAALFQLAGHHGASSPDDTTGKDDFPNNDSGLIQPLANLQVADSVFWGFAISGISEPSQVSEFVQQIKQLHPHASHIPYAWNIPPPVEQHETTSSSHPSSMMDDESSDRTPTQGGASPSGYDEDGEPVGSTGPFLLEQVRESRHETEGAWLFPEEVGGVYFEGAPFSNSGTAVVVVRYFGNQLLGVTCGRLSQCYQRIAQVTLHRLFRGCHVPLQLDFTTNNNTHHSSCLVGAPAGNMYGLAAGDTELYRNVVRGNREDLMSTLLDELDFGGFQGAQGELLPRLQNLQADFYQYDEATHGPVASKTGTIIPVYRYPGNYQGDEWETFPWSGVSQDIKDKVEANLPHFYNQQKMNHCVTNYYRHADDFIAHHSDKDLDLDKHAAIVSVSIGAERILELRRRSEPRDLTRIILPHGSMLLLGPITNAYFTHSILPVEEPDTVICERPTSKHDPNARISLTMRHVTTFLDTKTQRLFGEGVEIQSLQDLRRSQRWERISFAFGFTVFWRSCWYFATRKNNTLPSVIPMVMPWTTSSSSSSPHSFTSSNNSTMMKSLAQEIMVVLGSAVIGWWSYGGVLRVYHKRKEERAAREFFTKKSLSGTRY
jgi:alkylated DNA repair dioxygenase AlkB/putative IMPACT (imprinted ancient) family translation regulator